MDKILVLDFGGQYNQLIARRVRTAQVYAQIIPYNKITPEQVKAQGFKGIIFTGGPNSVYEADSPRCDKAMLFLGIPVLGICYGVQLIAYLLGGEVEKSEEGSEYGKTVVYSDACRLFDGVPRESVCWMSHTDYIRRAPAGFTVAAHTQKCPCAAICDEERKIYGVQFHPEVTHTEFGEQMLRNFLFSVCGCRPEWRMDSFVERDRAVPRKASRKTRPSCAVRRRRFVGRGGSAAPRGRGKPDLRLCRPRASAQGRGGSCRKHLPRAVRPEPCARQCGRPFP